MWFGHSLIGKILDSLICICLTILYFVLARMWMSLILKFLESFHVLFWNYHFDYFNKKKWHIYLNVIGGECYFRKSKNFIIDQSSLNLKKIGKFQKSWSDQFLWWDYKWRKYICSLPYFKRFVEIFIALESFEAFKGNPKKVT
jgi:hypothetical protein